jgi:hypothetical protein
MKVIKKLILGLFLLLLLSFIFFKYRKNIQPNSEKLTSHQRFSNLLWKLYPHYEIRTTLFGNPQKNILQLEKRFSRESIRRMMNDCDLTDIFFSKKMPYWHALERGGL